MEKRQLLSFLEKAIAGFERQDIFALKETANHAIEEAALLNDRRLAKLALVVYCLHKMSSKQHIVRNDRWAEIKHDILFDLQKAAKSVKAGDDEGFERWLGAVVDSVETTDKRMGNYVQNVFEKAKVKYASTAYSLGLGLGQAAQLTETSKKELLHYIGFTKMADREAITKGIAERLRSLKRKIGEKP